MTDIFRATWYRRAALLACLFTCISTPVLADHGSVSGGAGGAGAVSTISAATLPQGRLSVSLSNEHIQARPFSDAALIARAAAHIHAHSVDYMNTTSVNLGFGMTERLTISLGIPWVSRDNIRAGHHSHAGGGGAVNTAEGFGDSRGLGDMTLLSKYRFFSSAARNFEAAVLLGVKLPTGYTAMRPGGAARLDAEFQPGDGAWSPLAGFAVTKRIGPLSFDASLLYRKAGQGTQDTVLGDRASANLAATWRLGGEEHTHGTGSGARFTHNHAAWDLMLELNEEWGAKKETAGAVDDDSGGGETFVSPGLRYTAGAGWSAHISLGLPVADSLRDGHSGSRFRLLTGIGRTF